MNSLGMIGQHGTSVAKKIGLLRRSRGLSLRALAAEMAKTSRPFRADTLNKIELGVRRIDIDDVFALAEALGTTPARLLEPPEECSACHGQPPAGFACLACGATTSPSEAKNR
jgi:transcriptional regulator with XRE-family HTH domain